MAERMSSSNALAAGVLAGVLLLLLRHVRARKRRDECEDCDARLARLFVDPRIAPTVEAEAMQPRAATSFLVLHVGSEYGDLARDIVNRVRVNSHANGVKCFVVAVETDADKSRLGALETTAVGLGELVWHVRADSGFSIDPRDITARQPYDCVIVSRRFSSSLGLLGWAASSLASGGLIIVEGSMKSARMLSRPLKMERVSMVRGGWEAGLRAHRAYLRQRRAEGLGPLPRCYLADPAPYVLLTARRSEFDIPAAMRARSESSAQRARNRSITSERILMLQHHQTSQDDQNHELLLLAGGGASRPSSRKAELQRGYKMRVSCICIRDGDGGEDDTRDHKPYVLVLSNPVRRVGDWIFPGGGMASPEGDDPDLLVLGDALGNEEQSTPEQQQAAAQAVRHTLREAGVLVRIVQALGVFPDENRKTQTEYYLARVVATPCADDALARNRLWVHVDDAKTMVSRASSRAALHALMSRTLT